MATLGIFDTGFGGRYVAKQLQQLRPHDKLMIVDDRKHLPYGNKSAAEIGALTDQAIQPLLGHCDVIIIACNTATTLAIEQLRQAHPDTTFVGFEPMIKTAAELTKTGTIAILATPATLQSTRYGALKQTWAPQKRVLEPDCSTWAEAIESGAFDVTTATTLAAELVAQNADVISLACTHYLYLQPAVQMAVGAGAQVITPLAAVNQQISRVLEVA